VAVKLDINIPNFIPQKHFGGTAYFFPPHEKLGISQPFGGLQRRERSTILAYNAFFNAKAMIHEQEGRVLLLLFIFGKPRDAHLCEIGGVRRLYHVRRSINTCSAGKSGKIETATMGKLFPCEEGRYKTQTVNGTAYPCEKRRKTTGSPLSHRRNPRLDTMWLSPDFTIGYDKNAVFSFTV
jgi:hypothetical protein